MATENTAVAVVGAGIAGLVAASELRRSGVEVLVYEAGNRVGGNICTTVLETEAGQWLLETGPNTVRLADARMAQLIGQLGLTPQMQLPSRALHTRYVVRGGRLRALPTGLGALVRSGLLGWKSKWRIVTEARRKTPAPGPQTSIHQLVAERFSEEVADYVADPFVAGVYAGDARRLSAPYAMPGFVRLLAEHGSLLKGQIAQARLRRRQGLPAQPPIISFQGGMQALPLALAHSLGPAVCLSAEILRLAPNPAGGWNLELAGGRSVTHPCVIHTLGPDAALAHFEGTQVQAYLEPLGSLASAAATMLHLGFRRADVRHPLRAFGLLVPTAETHMPLLGALFPSSLFPNRAPDGHVLMAVFLGGARFPHQTQWPPERQIAHVLHHLSPVLGITGKPVLAHARTWQSAIPQYDARHGERLDSLRQAAGAFPSLRLAGIYAGGIGVPDRIAAGYEAAQWATEAMRRNLRC